MNSYLLMAGVLALLAVGVVGATPSGLTVAPNSAPPSCPVQLTVYAPAQVAASPAPFAVSAILSETGHCTFTAKHFVFAGLPGTSGPVASTSGVLLVTAVQPGTYAIQVIATSNLGGASAMATMVVV